MMQSVRLLLMTFVLLLLLNFPFFAHGDENLIALNFQQRILHRGDVSYPYAVYIPTGYNPSRKWPVILFLHGAGERGNDGWLQTQVGLGGAIRNHPERFKRTIVVFPQAPNETRWLDDPAEAAMQALDQTITEFHGDPKRIFLSGISMGG